MDPFNEEQTLFNNVSNQYFFTEFREYITTDFMSFISIFGALMFDTVNKNISRATNAYSEFYNKIMKHTVLKKLKNNADSQVVRKLENYDDGHPYASSLGDKAIKNVSKKDKNIQLYSDEDSNPSLKCLEEREGI